MKNTYIAVLLLAITLIQGCATITKGKTDTVQVQINNCAESISCTATNKKGTWHFSAPGPVTFTKSDNDLSLSCKDGPGTITQRLTPTRSSMAWGNVLVGGIIGGGVDAKTDAHWDMVDSISLSRNYCYGQAINGSNGAASRQINSPVVQPVQSAQIAPTPTEPTTLRQPTVKQEMPLSAGACKAPETPESLPENADQQDLLRAKRELEAFQKLNADYQGCLSLSADSNFLTEANKQALVTAHNMSVTIEEALVGEFNKAYDIWEAGK